MEITIRKATKNDLSEVLSLIKELALFEKQPQEVTITLEQLEQDGFGEHPLYWIILAEENGGIVGMSFYYIRYSTWKGRCLYLEDLVVKEKYKQQGIGKLLFEATLKEAKKMDAKLMNWQVLDWNEPAIQFYKKFNAELDDEWINGKIRL
ncbi:MAG: GNAT family N-acetyltransferase [Flavobacteriales bacterium CG18_big_fil_WC_8_21_14_2_50_32_9]|nr:GNAT family N-acetyltransferase [Flavobacteriales bacterium]PIQ14399.1 MAG: GNAT family N-acetyltransferase [Flavobacteriales bacterium CG18_big_fil_WC_8_21_14_2_50_32_9]PJC63085.1 MAG: GNAT family N-acetyltransferase [Flavobacteriales bacterium CG_4_9_14_0_2_um_filter_32_27]